MWDTRGTLGRLVLPRRLPNTLAVLLGYHHEQTYRRNHHVFTHLRPNIYPVLRIQVNP